MTAGGLEERLLEYAHLNYARLQLLEVGGMRPVEEAVVVLDGKRVVYFWSTDKTDQLVDVTVLGILVQERYRTDGSRNVYSLVKPVADEDKPAIERTIWFELTKMFGVVLPDKIKFVYWYYSDLPDSAAAQRPQQRE